ncbi:terpenoid cyclases/protein prenyltransferase alpha-alpha toroid [Zalerion maritima]|uniref:Protein farnesyltransferase subunit beta n=1 Tax=Zalerion maritima TaxID=339359 RepID=A0AAD5WLY7_9PEZI|nr:terpenoid cyclases/protein prenyltransferase alpha-alpha toroid [Zalerion maritima]
MAAGRGGFGIGGPDSELIDEEFVHDTSSPHVAAMVPDLFTHPAPIVDPLRTTTSQAQKETVNECLPFLADCHQPHNDHGVSQLSRPRHAAFVRKWLDQRMSRHFVAVDASRPWFLYWCIESLDLLGEDVSQYGDRLVQTASWMQNPTGGFGGGFGQTSHLATSYAVILALAIVGGGALYDVIDRRAMWKWLSSLKQPNGSFAMATGGEVDVRGAYCAAVIISLLNLPLELAPEHCNPPGFNLYTGLANYVQRCQTYEGGISGKPDAEAHGAYAFCALGCLSILDSPDRIIPKYLDIPRLVSWTSSRQYAPEGGFSGRTNKLVDGCYSHWIGGCWPLVEACLSPGGETDSTTSLYSREGLTRYILNCCQDTTKRGGLRDKPSRLSDAYHTCYVLAGLSSAQHAFSYSEREGLEPWGVSSHTAAEQVFGEVDRVGTLHPVYVIPQSKVVAIKQYFASKSGF